MARLFRFPFPFGSVPAPLSAESQAAIPVPGRWTNVLGGASAWGGTGSSIRQFHRIHVQTAQTFGASVNFAYRVNDAFPLKVKDNGDHVHVASTITNP